MEQWQQDNRRDVVMVDIDQLVPKRSPAEENRKVMIMTGCMNGLDRTIAMAWTDGMNLCSAL